MSRPVLSFLIFFLRVFAVCGRVFFLLSEVWVSVCVGKVDALAAPVAPNPNSETEKIEIKFKTKDERTKLFIALLMSGRILQIKMNGISVEPMGEEVP